MVRKKMKAFTLIELIAVLVIMAIIALIVTPLVMSIIRKARVSADKRSIDAYGRSIELAIAGYLLDNGTFPTDISQLTIEYSGSEVVCETTQLNPDSSLYLTGCTVAGRSVDYAYGEDKVPPAPIVYDEYEIGDEVTYNGVDYYVIADSSSSESTVTLLKAEPLTVDEVNTYSSGHVNMYNCDEYQTYCYHTANDINGYGGMAYYSSVDCGYGDDSNHTNSGCTIDYAQSDIKYVVDAWKTANVSAALEARLITMDELVDNLGYEIMDNGSIVYGYVPENAPSWIAKNDCWYWTMSPYKDSMTTVYYVGYGGGFEDYSIISDSGVVRPVIELYKNSDIIKK